MKKQLIATIALLTLTCIALTWSTGCGGCEEGGEVTDVTMSSGFECLSWVQLDDQSHGCYETRQIELKNDCDEPVELIQQDSADNMSLGEPYNYTIAPGDSGPLAFTNEPQDLKQGEVYDLTVGLRRGALEGELVAQARYEIVGGPLSCAATPSQAPLKTPATALVLSALGLGLFMRRRRAA